MIQLVSLTESDRQATRAELTKIDEQLELVRNGKNRLEEIQEQLIDEFMSILDEWKSESDDLDSLYEEAEKSLDIARSMEGKVRLRSISEARSEGIKIENTVENIAGVKIPQIISKNDVETDLEDRGYGILGSNARIDTVCENYEKVTKKLIKVAEIETAMQLLLDEIERVSRRVNAFEYQVLPNLRSEKKNIEQKLMEKERQEIYQLKMVKEKKQQED